MIPEFNDLVEKTAKLPLESQEVFIDIVLKNYHLSKRKQIRNDIILGRKDHKEGKTSTGSFNDLMKEISL